MIVTPAMVRAICRRLSKLNDPRPSMAEDKVLVLAVQRDIEHDLAMETMLQGHRGLVYRVANKWARADLFDDAVSVGMMGLAQAIRRFETDRDIRFSTYATYWIESKIRRTTVQAIHHAHVPEHNLYRWLRLKRWMAEVEEETGRYPDPEDAMEHFGFTKSEFDAVRSVGLMEMMSIDQSPVPQDQMRDMEHLKSPESFVLDDMESTRLAESISILDPIQRYIVRRVYGLDCEAMSLQAIGDELGITRSAIHQRLKTIHRTLKKAIQ